MVTSVAEIHHGAETWKIVAETEENIINAVAVRKASGERLFSITVPMKYWSAAAQFLPYEAFHETLIWISRNHSPARPTIEELLNAEDESAETTSSVERPEEEEVEDLRERS